MIVALAVATGSLFVSIAFGLLTRRRLARMEDAFESASSQLEVLQKAFHQFVPHRVVEDIIERGVSIRGERRDVTVLFADLVGFTSMSEKLKPEDVVEILNGYFQAMSLAITRHNGHVAKFIGDGIMATFGAPDPNPWHPMDGVRAALAMRAALSTYNKSLAARGRPPIRVSIGLHTGPVVAGVLGSAELVEYTVIGDVVNTAARVEGLTRAHGVDILFTQSVREHLDGRFTLKELPALEVKGKAEKVATFAVESFTDAT